MKKTLISILFSVLSFYSFADEPLKPLILDILMGPTVMQSHFAQNYILDFEINENQKKIIGYQKIIDEKLGKIDTLEMKMQNYRSTLHVIMSDANQRQYVANIVDDIAKKQQELNKLASENTVFQSVADDANMELNKRAQKVTNYMDKCGQYAGLKGQLDNKERTDMTLFVVKELSEMRGVAVKALQTIKTAKYNKYLGKDMSGLLKQVYSKTECN